MAITMTAIDCTLLGFSHKDVLLSVFEGYSNDFVFTSDGVFRRLVLPVCPGCGGGMTHNGYNVYRKKGLGCVKIGRYACSCCGAGFEEERDFWVRLKADFFEVLDRLYQLLRDHHVSYGGISSVMKLLFPRGKDTVASSFNRSVERVALPLAENIQIVHYDEQHPKRGRTQKYRLTLLNGANDQPIADELFDNKDSETIKAFLIKHLDLTKPVFIVTDMAPSYPKVFEDLFGPNLIHQFCLLHLSKRIVKDFPRRTTIAQEYMKYRLLDIFYNRTSELEFLEQLLKEEQLLDLDEATAYLWNKDKKNEFYKFLHKQELTRRREKRNIEQRTYIDSSNKLASLLKMIDTFGVPVQKRLRKIEKNWNRFTAFHLIEDAPATNNPIENYYSTTLKTHRKKQFRTDRGIENQMKLGHMKRAGMLDKQDITLLQVFHKFTPFLDPG